MYVMSSDILAYNKSLTGVDRTICDALYTLISGSLHFTESKIWHGHPVWFIKGNPIVGYHKLKDCVRLLFWSGQSFDEPELKPEGSFKAAEERYTDVKQINEQNIIRWLGKATSIQWDYKNIVKRRGKLDRIS